MTTVKQVDPQTSVLPAVYSAEKGNVLPRQSPFDKAAEVAEVTLEHFKCQGTPSPTNKMSQRFTILFTGDTHSHLEPSVVKFIAEKPLGGVVRRINCLESVQKLLPHPVLILDVGDFLQGTPYFEKFAGEPDIEFMNMAGYRVITVGNHDFDNGWEHLEKLLKKGNFKALCANILRKSDQSLCLPPYSLLQVGESKVALVGIMGTSAWQSIRPSLRSGLELKDPLSILNEILPELRPHVDLIVLLSHSGILEDRKLAEHPLLDVILGGHSHTFMERHETVGKTPVFHAFRHGNLIGKMDLALANGKLAEATSSVIHLDEQYDQPHASQAVLQKYQNILGNTLKVPLGICLEPLSSREKMAKLVPLGIHLAEMIRQACSADVGCVYSGSIKIGVSTGPFTVEDVHNILPHRDALLVAIIQGSLLIKLMQEGHLRWGGDRTFQYAGLDLDEKGLTASIKGAVVQNERTYTLAAPSFFFEREIWDDQFQILPPLRNQVVSIEEKVRDMREPIIAYIKANGLPPWIKKGS